MNGLKNLPAIMQQIVSGAAPEKFNVEHLKGLGFKSSGDRAIIPLLKDLGFLTSDGTPTQRYLAYRDPSKSKSVLGEALREAYGDLFLINDNLSQNDRVAIEGKFKSSTNSTDRVSELQAATFCSSSPMCQSNLTLQRPRLYRPTFKRMRQASTHRLNQLLVLAH